MEAPKVASITHEHLLITGKFPLMCLRGLEPERRLTPFTYWFLFFTAFPRPFTTVQVSSKPTSTIEPNKSTSEPTQERVFFDGGTHSEELIANLPLGLTLLWLPLTQAAVSRAFFLRYRFTNLRVTVISGLTGQDRSDFSYKIRVRFCETNINPQQFHHMPGHDL
ncbi:hypothetical protein Cgig2_024831 [Carnegiea gigantea]|uniref:Uncharacterized protein n=1 Tax=Carnegiea gigantea TaxID=171969 RepID=A0A9Q1KD51_9CARY|nr:hypothetical protein Cgig2_024831 [Carnegiea gigantea]